MNRLSVSLIAALLLAPCAVLPATGAEEGVRHGQVAPTDDQKKPAPWLLHLPGISGYTGLDREMIQGLKDGGYDGVTDTFDWTANNPGIPALLASKRNHEQAGKIADLILNHFRSAPDSPIIITTHSAGAGLCAWALESLPDDVKVDTILLLSPALSPDYDLSKALSHVRGNAYAFTSPTDSAVLGIGTRMLGTIDGKYTVAAGRAGFRRPEEADPVQYRKLVSKPYDAAWMKYNNIGDHVGMMSQSFAKAVLAPIVLATRLDVTPPRPTTQSLSKNVEAEPHVKRIASDSPVPQPTTRPSPSSAP